jgi:hypothetical protein
MSQNGKRLVSGVRELLRTEKITLEDMHMVASDVVLHIDRIAARTVRKLKNGQKIRCYDEDSYKEYGQRGSDIVCFFEAARDTKTKGQLLRVYLNDEEWSVGVDCLLEVFDDFDPESEEGKRRLDTRPKRRGRRKKEAESFEPYEEPAENWSPAPEPEYEQEVEGEEYDFNSLTEFDEYFDYDN